MAITNISFAQETPVVDSYTLQVEITGFRNFKGNVLVQVYNEEEEVIKAFIVDFQDKKCNFTLDELPAGKYAIQYFHDENSNRRMESNFMGIPKEGYGFSNNAKGYFGPPKFVDWLFPLNADTNIKLEISYLL